MSVFHLQIVTADGLFFDGEAERIIVRTITGDVCLLAHHIDYVTALGMGECQVVDGEGKTRSAACIGGMLSMIDNEARLVATTFEWADEIDVSRAERARKRAEERLSQQLDATDLELAQAKLKRALTRINVAK